VTFYHKNIREQKKIIRLIIQQNMKISAQCKDLPCANKRMHGVAPFLLFLNMAEAVIKLHRFSNYSCSQGIRFRMKILTSEIFSKISSVSSNLDRPCFELCIGKHLLLVILKQIGNDLYHRLVQRLLFSFVQLLPFSLYV
jgi:hypothetical protein